MTNITITTNGASITAISDGKITSGMVGIPVHIEYDNSWDNLTKTAFFRVGNQVRKRINVSESTTVPWEILRTHGKPLEIGIEGRDAAGNIVMPTIWAIVCMVYQGASGEIPAAPEAGDIPSGGGADGIAPDTIIECGPFYGNDPTEYVGYWFERRLDGTFTMKIMLSCDLPVDYLRNETPLPVCFLEKLPFCIFEVNNVVLDLEDNYPIDADNKKYFVGDLIQETPGIGMEYEIPGVSDNASLYVTLTEPSIFDNLPEYVTTVQVSGYATITGRWRE